MRLRVKNIFVDTNIFEENNFFQSTNIQSLFYYSRIGIINLYMTSISKMELIDRMKKRVWEVKEEHNKFVNAINKSRILRNLTVYESIEKPVINVETSVNEFSAKLETIIGTSKIKIIPANLVKIEDVFKVYYDKQPPFSHKGKKTEFPDAFIFETISSWCKKKRKRIIFLTKDTDFDGINSRYVLFKNDLSGLLSEISAYYDSTKNDIYLPYIAENLRIHENEIISLIEEELNSRIKVELDYENMSTLRREPVRFLDYKISSIRAEHADISYFAEFGFSVSIFPTHEEIEKSVFPDSLKPVNLTEKIKIVCDLELHLHNRNDIKLKWINSNQRIFISKHQ